MLTRVGDEHMGRFVREALAARGRRRRARCGPTRGASPASCCSASRARKASRTFSTARTAPTWASSRPTSTRRPSPRPRRLRSPARTCRPMACARPSRRAIALAKQHGLRVVLDIDYRPVLWGLAGHGGGAEREQGLGRGDAADAGLPARLRPRGRHRGGDPRRRRRRERARGAARDPRAHRARPSS